MLADVGPSALLMAAAAAVDALELRGGTLATGGLADAALALSALGVLSALGLPGAVRVSALRRAGIREIDAMTGRRFEERLALLYRAMGFDVRHTGQRGDFGADLVIERQGERSVVQAKRYRGAVGIEAVQQAVGAARYYGADGSVVVTNSTCTAAARALAAAGGVELVERDALVRLLARHPERSRGTGAAGALVRQLLEGARLCAFALGAVLRLAWWLVRALARMVRGVARAG